MEGRPVDRTPLMCQMSIGHMLLQLDVSPADFWCDRDTFARGLVHLQRQYAFDGILVSLHGHSPRWTHQVRERMVQNGVERILWQDGTSTDFLPDELPQMITAHSVVPAEAERSAVPSVLHYIPVSQGLHFRIDDLNPFGIFPSVRALAGPDVSIHGEVTSPFDYFLDWCGVENGLMLLIDAPATAHAMLRTFAHGVASIAAGMCAEDIDAVKISSPFAGGGFLSRDHYATFILPYERLLVEAIQSRSKHAYIHTCGAIGDRLDLIQASGAHGLECLDPPPLGTVDLDRAFAQLSGKMFVKGNIDSVNSLLLGTPESIVADARRRESAGRAYGKFILSTACSIAPRVLRSHVDLLRSVVEHHS